MCPTLGAGRRLDNCGNTNCRLIISATITWVPKESGFLAEQNPAYRVSAPRPCGGVFFLHNLARCRIECQLYLFPFVIFVLGQHI